MQDFLARLDATFLDNTLGDWLLAAALFVTIFLAVEFIRSLVRSRRRRWQQGSGAALELLGGFAAATSRLVVISVALYFSKQLLQLPLSTDRVFKAIIVAGIAVQLALWATVALRFGVERHYRRAGGEDVGARASVGALLFIGQLVIWAVFTLLALDNLGINITALVAGLGVGGIAVALAVQTILSDLFGSMSIALDKPFVVGDQLRIDDIEGTVEHIGIKSTRLRSVTGEQVILSNADVLKSRVRNLGRIAERRVLFRLRVAYETPHERIGEVGALVQRVVEAQPATRFVQCLLMALGQDALEFELICFVASRADVNHAATVHAINLGIVREFAAHGIGFAYPTRRVLVDGEAHGDDRTAAARSPAPPSSA